MKVLFVVAGLMAIVALSSALPHKHHAFKAHNSRKIKSDLTALHRDLEAVTHGKPSFKAPVHKLAKKAFKAPKVAKVAHAAEDFEDSDDSDNEVFEAPVAHKNKFAKVAAKPKVASKKFSAPKHSKNAPVAAVDEDSESAEDDDETFSAPQKAHGKFAKKLAAREDDEAEFDADESDDDLEDEQYSAPPQQQFAPVYGDEDEDDSLLGNLNPFAHQHGNPSMVDDAVNTIADMTPDLGLGNMFGLEEEDDDNADLEEDGDDSGDGWGLF